jgi:hypothetical protein
MFVLCCAGDAGSVSVLSLFRRGRSTLVVGRDSQSDGGLAGTMAINDGTVSVGCGTKTGVGRKE